MSNEAHDVAGPAGPEASKVGRAAPGQVVGASGSRTVPQMHVVGTVHGDVVVGDKRESHHHLHHDARPHVDVAALGIGRSTTELVGRDEEIEAIVSALRGAGGEAGGEAASVVIHGVRGMGGLGKTALAREAAWRLRDRWPSQHLIDLRGAPGASGGFGTVGPLTWQAAMRQIVQHLRPTERLPDSDADGQESALRAIYAGDLSRRPMLLVLDNALDASQVAPLLPPHGSPSAVIVASRHSFTLPGGIVMRELGLLEPKAAAQLARVHAARLTEDQATRLAVDLCGRLPLAIEIVARAVAIEELELVGSMLDGLAKARVATIERLRDRAGATDLASLETAIAWAFRRLPDDGTRERFLDLAIFPASFDEAAAVAVWGMEDRPDEARETLRALRKLHLVLIEDGASATTAEGSLSSAARRFSLHDLVRDWAGGCRAEPGEADARRRECATRFVDLFAARLAEGDRRYLSGDQVGGLAAFDLERANIEAGFAMLSDSQLALPERASRAVRYVGAGVHLLNLRLHPRTRIVWFELQRDAAREIGDRRREGHALGNLGGTYWYLGDLRQALRLQEQLLAIARERGDQRGEVAALCSLGAISGQLAETRRAIDYFEEASAMAHKGGDRRTEGGVLGNLAIAYTQLGDLTRAMRCHERALAITRELGDRCGEARTLVNVGLSCMAVGNARRAIESCEQAALIAREVGDRCTEGCALGGLGHAYRASDEPRLAIDRFEQHVTIAREAGDRRAEAIASWNLGFLLIQIGERERGAALARVWLDYARELGHPAVAQYEAQLAAALEQARRTP